MNAVEIREGDGPVVLGMPHTGLQVPPDATARLNATGRALADTDWNIHQLYAGLLPRATVVRTLTHRYVIDANRDPGGESLYPGQNTTGLCPLTDFDGAPIYAEGRAPDAAEIAARRAAYHAPYHAALAGAVEKARARHGAAILFDCHSIRSCIPFLFDGVLPDFNIGTDGGRTCATAVEAAVRDAAAAAAGYTHVLNGRFRGGWTTRHYGRPETGVHAIQLELAQSAYMHEAPPWAYAPDRADRLRTHLKDMLERLEALALSGALTGG